VAPKARRRRIGWGLAAMPPALAGLAAAPEGRGIALGSVRVDLLVAATSSFLLSLCVSSAIGLVATILQEAAPDHLRGRVMSLQGLMFLGTLPVASLLAGRAAEVAGQRLELLLAAALHGLGAALLFRWLPGRAGGGISRTDM
jgi:ENTS family enterobactin (siderophore) exporter